MEPPQDILDEPSGLAAFHIYAQSWQPPNHTTSTTESSLQLRQIILDNEDKEEAAYSIIRVVHKFACKAPPPRDHALSIVTQGFAQRAE